MRKGLKGHLGLALPPLTQEERQLKDKSEPVGITGSRIPNVMTKEGNSVILLSWRTLQCLQRVKMISGLEFIIKMRLQCSK